MALLCPTTIKIPTTNSIMMIGVSHQAFLTLKKLQISPKKVLLPTNRYLYLSYF